MAQTYLPPSYVFSHSADSCSTQARASAFLVNPSICVSRPCGGVTRTHQPFPLFTRTGSNLAFGVETGIVILCDALHQNTRTKFLSLIRATGAQIDAMLDAQHGITRMEPMDLLADTRRSLADAIRQLAAIEAGAPIAKPLTREQAINIVTEQIGLFESVLRRYGGGQNGRPTAW